MRGDPSAEALSYKQVSRSASEPLLLSPVNSNIPCGQRVSAREAEKKRRSRFAAWKAWRGIEGHNRRASGARDSSEPSRSESEAERVWKVASGTWETCGAKASAGGVRGHSSGEAGQCPWMRRASACKRDDANQMARTIMSKDCNRGTIRYVAARRKPLVHMEEHPSESM